MSLEQGGLVDGLRDWAALVGVGAYLGGVGVYLRLSGKVQPDTPLGVLVRRARGLREDASFLEIGRERLLTRVCALRPRARRGVLREIHPDAGFAYAARIPVYETDDCGRSSLELFEDGLPLGPGHVQHREIAEEGAGRYSHFGVYVKRLGARDLLPTCFSRVVFSASDNSDPRSNGREYSFHVR